MKHAWPFTINTASVLELRSLYLNKSCSSMAQYIAELCLSSDSALKYDPDVFLTGLVRFTSKREMNVFIQQTSLFTVSGENTVSTNAPLFSSSARMFLSITAVWRVRLSVLSISMIRKHLEDESCTDQTSRSQISLIIPVNINAHCFLTFRLLL